MALFSDSEKIKIHSNNTESSDPVMTDIIDLRRLKGGRDETRPKHAPHQAEETPRSKQKKTEEPKVISRYFEETEKPPFKPTTHPKRSSKKLWYTGSFIVLCGGVFALLSTTFASSTILIQPKKEENTLSKISITVDPGLSLMDVDSRRIPGEAMQFTDDVSMSFKATGQKYVETKAKGTIAISNAFSSSPQTLVQATRFQENKNGKIYRLTRSITIPGAKIEDGKIVPSSIDAEVAADTVGDSNNITEGSFLIPGFKGTPKYEAFTAVVKTPIAGGFKGTTQVVSKDDLDKANAAFQQEALNRLRAKSAENILPGFTTVPAAETFDVVSKTAPAINDPADTFTISAKLRLQNIAFQEKTLYDLLNQIVYKDNLFKEKTVLPEKSKITFDSASLSSDNKLRLSVSGTLTATGVIPTATLQNALAGKSTEDARATLRGFPGVGAFGLKIFPFWRSTIPNDTGRIAIELQKVE